MTPRTHQARDRHRAEHRADIVRTIALAGSCAAFVAVPNLGAVLGEGEETDRYDTVITPPGYAFTVWAPIFAGCVADTVAQCRATGRRREASRRTGWPLAGAYTLNTLWSLAAQQDRFALTPLLLPTATALTGVAHRRLQHLQDPPRLTALATGALLGWTALASTVNLAAAARLLGAPKASPAAIAATSAGLSLTTGILARYIAGNPRGATATATTSAWGLATTALTPSRPPATRATAAAATLAVIATAARRRRR
ncbi:hypothetical protein KC207_15870 [Phycicoccus sp. BSK3Z-2]|uniref:Tryptophan-rich sensory protein n=1 Tax=Phycicoccus avicenniae TaxID=2828860 RepID=A0A941D9W1_9MICO|nr:hypothetical protein [Phycicoccus avicenniae]MBR7744774.1 hypothetical protein [Phycicoccus avicenniae]